MLFLLLLAHGAFAVPVNLCETNFEFASYYASNMVLQRSPSSAVIWGYATEDGDQVTLNIGEEEYTTSAADGPTGRPQWSITIAARDASEDPVSISASSRECTISMDNVLFGDVYICSGQSNMVHTLQNMDDAEPDVEDVENYPNVRSFFTATELSTEVQYDLIRVQRNWAEPTPDNMRGYSAVCWMFGKHLYQKYGRPIGLVQTAWDGTRIQAWSSPEALDVCFPDGPGYGPGANEATVLYNAMIHPFLPMPIYGAIWYQGEGNAWQPDDYVCAIREMVNDWRAKWYERSGEQTALDFPFGQCQLAPNRNIADPNTGFPKLRWAQAGYLGYLPNENGFDNHFMAVAADLPDFDSPHGSIHPRYKRQIAERLALAAYVVAYDDNSEGRFQGPFPTQFSVGDGSLTVTFDNGNSDIRIEASGEEWAVGYEVCCASGETTCPDSDARWQEAPISSNTASAVELSVGCGSEEVITGLRYIWRESPCELERCPVYSVDNDLPAPPYRYDGLIAGDIEL